MATEDTATATAATAIEEPIVDPVPADQPAEEDAPADAAKPAKSKKTKAPKVAKVKKTAAPRKPSAHPPYAEVRIPSIRSPNLSSICPFL